VLAVQAMFPVTSRDEMRGRVGESEIGSIDDANLHDIWSALTTRLVQIPGYVSLFAQAYPDKRLDELSFVEAANAIAAFEAAAYTYLDSPWDRYVDGDLSALTTAQKRGALLFYGKAKCVNCHSGSLLTDQQHYNLAVPQLGPGKAPFQPFDVGRFLESANPDDLFRFRTPPLRNVAATGPWMHNGAFNDLHRVVRHHANPVISLLMYDPQTQIDQPAILDTVMNDWQTQLALIRGIDWPDLPRRLQQREVDDLVEFLEALTAPNLEERLIATIPASVPSGLPIDGMLP
jgi:cytochrome c peroxidase